MLQVVCVKHGTKYGPEYVNILFDMVRRNLSEGYEGKFICFTEDAHGLDDGIESRPLPKAVNGWWNKLYLFKEGLFPKGDRIVYFDLDTVITGNLDDILKYDNKFAILRDFYRPNGLQSSVMAWESGYGADIWDYWVGAGSPEIDGGDQAWIEKHVNNPDIWQDLYPGSFVSYKVHCKEMFPKNAKVIVFHGNPRPHEIIEGWVPRVWKIGGGIAAELQTVCNTDTATLVNHIEFSSTLPYPWLQMNEVHEEHAIIVGGGPSLNDTLNHIEERFQHGQKVFSTNGTYDILTKAGIAPDFHIMADAREDNVEFIPYGSLCLYSSQCHPRVFEKAEQNKNHIVVWHPLHEGIMDIIGKEREYALVGGGSTVGLKAAVIAFIMGYRHLHLYGFDSSYHNDEHHAYKQPLNNNERVLDVHYEGRDFKCAAWMATQAEEFKVIADMLVGAGCTLTVHGDGLIPHMSSKMMSEPALTAADIRASEILKRMNGAKTLEGAEIGVFAGDLSKRLLRREGLILHMVDSWAISDSESDYAKSGDFHATLSWQSQEAYYQQALITTSFAGKRAKIVRKSSLDAAETIQDKSLDFVFIDADHSYEAVKNDIEAWENKVKTGGYLSGHDYDNKEYPCFGVKQAVDEWARERGIEIELGDNYTWFAKI